MRPMVSAAFCAAVLLGGNAFAQVPSGSATTDLIAQVPDALTAAVAIKAKLVQVLQDWAAASDDLVKDFQRECGIAGPTFSVGPRTQDCAGRLAENLASARTAAAASGSRSGTGGPLIGGGGPGASGTGGGADVCEGDIPDPELLKLFTGCPPTTQGTIEYMGSAGRPAVVNCGNGQTRYEVVMAPVAAVTHTEPIGSTTRTVVDSPAHCAYSLGGAVSPVEFPLPPAPPPLPEAGFWQEYGWLVATGGVVAGVLAVIGYLDWANSGPIIMQTGNPPAGGGR